MAKHFAASVSNVQESSLRATAVPATTKADAEWHIHLWEDWTSHRAAMLHVCAC